MAASNRCQAKGHVGEKQEYACLKFSKFHAAFKPMSGKMVKGGRG